MRQSNDQAHAVLMMSGVDKIGNGMHKNVEVKVI